MSNRNSRATRLPQAPLTDPATIDLPPIGIELLQAIDAANQRFRDWASGYLAGRGVTAAYAPQGTPEGVKLVRQAAPEEAAGSLDDPSCP